MTAKLFVRNMGPFDRALRALVVAPVALVAALAVGVSSIGGIVLLVVAGIGLATGVAGRCPTYVPFGIDTHGRGRVHALLPH